MASGNILAFDVGGTSVKAGIVTEGLRLVDGSLRDYPIDTQAPAVELIEAFCDIAEDQHARGPGNKASPVGLAIAFPGPFDYARGISWMRGQGKFDELYGINLRDLLPAALSRRDLPWLPRPLPLCFENDVVAFASGEWRSGLGAGKQRSLFITLGTGCGSTFLDGGRRVVGQYGLPDHGMLFDQPFAQGSIDDHLSRRGILAIARSHGIADSADVADLAVWADEGDERCLRVFNEFGVLVANILLPWIDRFRPQIVVLGGNIARAFRHFGSPLVQGAQCWGCEVRVSLKLSESALIGVTSCLLRQMRER